MLEAVGVPISTTGNESIVILAAVLAIASITDIKSHRIPNWLTYPGVLLGLGLKTISFGTTGFLVGVAGMLLGLALLGVFYVFGGMGAGDVKLMGVIGAFLGPVGVFWAFFFSAIAGGIYAIAIIFFHPKAKATRIAVAAAIINFLHFREVGYNKSEASGRQPVLRYGVAIAVGTVFAVVFKYA